MILEVFHMSTSFICYVVKLVLEPKQHKQLHIYHNSWKGSNKSRNNRNPCAYGPKYDIIFFIVLHRQRIIINQPSIHLNNRHTNNVYTPITMGLESYLLFPKMENKKWKILAACTVDQVCKFVL